MIHFKDNLKKLRESRSLSQDDLAYFLGISGKTISSWEIGRTEPNMGMVELLAERFGVTVDDLVFGQVKKHQYSFIKIPQYSSISCGSATFLDDLIEEYVTLPSSLLNPIKQYFCQYAKGDSMIGENIMPGDLLVFEKTDVIEDGKIGCFCVDHNEATCKKFYQDKESDMITLQPANDKYLPIFIKSETIPFRIIGKLILVINKRG